MHGNRGKNIRTIEKGLCGVNISHAHHAPLWRFGSIFHLLALFTFNFSFFSPLLKFVSQSNIRLTAEYRRHRFLTNMESLVQIGFTYQNLAKRDLSSLRGLYSHFLMLIIPESCNTIEIND